MGGYLERFDQTPATERWPLVRRWMFEEPLPFYAELRKYRPVLAMPDAVLAARYADCAEILRRFDVFSVRPTDPNRVIIGWRRTIPRFIGARSRSCCPPRRVPVAAQPGPRRARSVVYELGDDRL